MVGTRGCAGGGQLVPRAGHPCHAWSPTSRCSGGLIFIETRSLQWFYLENQNLSHLIIWQSQRWLLFLTQQKRSPLGKALTSAFNFAYVLKTT